MTTQPASDSPPAYEDAAQSSAGALNAPAHPAGSAPVPSPDAKPFPYPDPIQVYTGLIGPPTVQQPRFMPPPTIHHYINPRTGERVASLLPPNHPEMVCLQAGMHEPQTKFGIFGILAAIVWFPFGIGLCILDRQVRCERCGALLNDGLCS